MGPSGRRDVRGTDSSGTGQFACLIRLSCLLFGSNFDAPQLPAGLPKPTSPVIPWEAIPDLLVFGSVITLIGFMESVTLAKKFAIKHEYEIHPNQELIALGLANFVGSFFLSYPAIGAMSRYANTLSPIK